MRRADDDHIARLQRLIEVTHQQAGKMRQVLHGKSTIAADESGDFEVTVEDPTVWTRPWTAKQEFTRQSDQENRIYNEPRCIEGNYGLPGLLLGHRMEDLAFAEGRGPDPRTISTVNAGDAERDPLQ